jgi:uncharacterized protein YjgD (DUF1641 family)
MQQGASFLQDEEQPTERRIALNKQRRKNIGKTIELLAEARGLMEEANAKAAAAKLQKALKSITPEQMEAAIKKLGVDPAALGSEDPDVQKAAFDKLTKALESNPAVNKVKNQVKQLQGDMKEWVLEEGFWDIVNTLATPIKYLAKKALETIAHVLEPIPVVGGVLSKAFAPWRKLEKNIGKGRVNYTGMLLITFLLSPMLLTIGVTTGHPGFIAGGLGTMGWSLGWWIYMLFAKAIMEPIMMFLEPPGPGYAAA